MVEIRIVIEGGVLPNLNVDAATINNSEKLREAFHKLLSQVVDPDKFNLIIELGAGNLNATKSFKKYAIIDGKASLLVDLDGPKPLRDQRLKEFEIQEFTERVFFMIQEMEAWILSQPNVLIKCYDERYIRERANIDIVKTENDIFSIHSEEIVKPSEKLKVILGRYYSVMKVNVKKKKKYGKLKDAPFLIEHLDIHELIKTFEDVKSLIFHIKN